MKSQTPETQKSPNRKLGGPARTALAATATLGLLVGIGAASNGDKDSSPKNNAPAATAEAAPTQETGMPPVPESSEMLKDQLAAQAQSMGESYIRQTIELAKQANNDTIFSEMYINNDGDVNFVLHLTNDSGNGTVTDTKLSFVTGVKGDREDTSLDDFDPSSFRSFSISSGSTTTFEDGAMTGQELYSLNISSAEKDRSGFIVTLGGDEQTVYDTRYPQGSSQVMEMDAKVIPKIQGNTDLFLEQAALPL